MPNTDPLESERLLVSSISGSIVKGIFYICLTVVFGIYLSNCSLDNEVIEQCQTSCKNGGGYMESVTSSKCVCSSDNPTVNPWVLPTN